MTKAIWLAKLRASVTSAMLLVAAFTAASPVRAEPISERELRAFVTSFVERTQRDRGYLDSIVNKGWSNMLDKDRLPIVSGMVSALMSHEAMQDYMLQVLRPLLSDNSSRETVSATMLEAMVTLQSKGVRRLNVDQQAAFVKLSHDFTGWLPPKACKAIFVGRLNTQQMVTLERRYALTLPLDKFEDYIALYRAAALAELNDYPSARTVNETQAKGAKRAFVQAFMAKTGELPADLLARVGDAPADADAEDACPYFRSVLTAILSMKEPYRTWQLNMFIAEVE